jgi:trehalose/maltose hydrolase-like predicted phosphorylase
VRASKRKKRASIKEREEPKLDSVLDFLYYDNRRVALLIAQFDDFGLLQQIERTETTAESATDKARMSANIGPRSLSLQTASIVVPKRQARIAQNGFMTLSG